MANTPQEPAPQEPVSQEPARTEPEDDESGSRVPALIGLAVVAVLVVIALYLVGALHKTSQTEDCLMSGRTNCAPITPGH